MTDPSTPRRKLSYQAFTECWYVDGETHIVDLIHPDDGLTLHGGHDAQEIRGRYPGAIRTSCEAAWRMIDAAALARYRQDVSEISEERFTDALNVLPPVGWTTLRGVESFKLSECLWGNITDIYARLGDRYFKLVDDIRTPAATIAERIAAYAAAHPSGDPLSDNGIEPQRPLDGGATPRSPKPGAEG